MAVLINNFFYKEVTTMFLSHKLYNNILSSNQEIDFKSGLPSGINLAPQWVTGIIDSEGNLSILVQKTKNGHKISLAFKVAQKEHSKGILLDLQKYFGCGNLYWDNKKEDAYKFSVNKIDDIINKVIPHLDKYPLLTSKNLDYLDFRKVALLMKNKLHLNKEVMDNILLTKDNMNSLRPFVFFFFAKKKKRKMKLF